MLGTRCLAIGGLALATGCGSAAGAGGAPSGIPGYEHTLARSTFSIGTFQMQQSSGAVERTVGSVGTFAVEESTLAATGMPNETIPRDASDVFPGDVTAHEAAVRKYLVHAGLQDYEILSVSADSTGVSTSDGVVVLSTSVPILHRGFQGTPIEGSEAWAILSASGASVEEQVYWPAIDQSIVDQVHAFQAAVADPQKSAAMLAALPSGVTSGQVVIRHTSWFWQGPFQALVCYRANWSDGTTLCVDLGGHPVRLVDETQ